MHAISQFGCRVAVGHVASSCSRPQSGSKRLQQQHCLSSTCSVGTCVDTDSRRQYVVSCVHGKREAVLLPIPTAKLTHHRLQRKRTDIDTPEFVLCHGAMFVVDPYAPVVEPRVGDTLLRVSERRSLTSADISGSTQWTGFLRVPHEPIVIRHQYQGTDNVAKDVLHVLVASRSRVTAYDVDADGVVVRSTYMPGDPDWRSLGGRPTKVLVGSARFVAFVMEHTVYVMNKHSLFVHGRYLPVPMIHLSRTQIPVDVALVDDGDTVGVVCVLVRDTTDTVYCWRITDNTWPTAWGVSAEVRAVSVACEGTRYDTDVGGGYTHSQFEVDLNGPVIRRGNTQLAWRHTHDVMLSQSHVIGDMTLALSEHLVRIPLLPPAVHTDVHEHVFARRACEACLGVSCITECRAVMEKHGCITAASYVAAANALQYYVYGCRAHERHSVDVHWTIHTLLLEAGLREHSLTPAHPSQHVLVVLRSTFPYTGVSAAMMVERDHLVEHRNTALRTRQLQWMLFPGMVLVDTESCVPDTPFMLAIPQTDKGTPVHTLCGARRLRDEEWMTQMLSG